MINQMGTAQREAFFAKLLSFTGNDATPSLRSREGSHYEYDSEAAGTVEITRAMDETCVWLLTSNMGSW